MHIVQRSAHLLRQVGSDVVGVLGQHGPKQSHDERREDPPEERVELVGSQALWREVGGQEPIRSKEERKEATDGQTESETACERLCRIKRVRNSSNSTLCSRSVGQSFPLGSTKSAFPRICRMVAIQSHGRKLRWRSEPRSIK